MKKSSNQFIILQRAHNKLVDILVSYKIYINDKQVGKINNGQELKIKVDNGINNDSILYDSMVVLNTKQPHGVRTPSKERIVFHMGIHDIGFEDLK